MSETAEDLGEVIIGDVPIAKAIFGDARHRRLIPQLKSDGWPIFEILGKRAARRSRLAAEVVERERAAKGTAA